MKREIKFQAWDGSRLRDDFTIDSFGVPLELEEFNPGGCSDPECCPQGEDYYVRRPDWTLMQYTSLKDRNGREIYEGDVVRLVKHLRFDDCIDMEVQFHNGSFVMVYTGAQGGAGRSKYSEAFHSPMFDPCRRDTMEVIGNIHENPELLKP